MKQSDEKKQCLSRRETLKVLAATGAVSISTLPNKWEKPLIEVGILPAHAQTSPLAQLSNLTVPLITQDGCGVGVDLYDSQATYNDLAGAVTAAATVLQVGAVFQPSGISADFVDSTPNITGNGFTGTIGTGICIGFGADTSIDISLSYTNDNGVTSNVVTVNVPNQSPVVTGASDQPSLAPSLN